jgi:hypothetical protein
MRVVSDQNGSTFISLCHTKIGILLSVVDPELFSRILVRILLFRSFRIPDLAL